MILYVVKKVTVKVSSPKYFYQILKEAKKLGIKISDNDGEILINDEIVNKLGSIDNLMGYLVCKVRDKDEFNELLIGIDTNDENNLSIAVVGDGELIESKACNLLSINDELEKIIRKYPHKKVIIGIGGGNKLGELTYRIVKMKFENAKIVKEERSSLKNPFINIKDRDIRAAYIIALRATLYEDRS